MQITPFLSAQGVISYLIINSKNQAILIDPSLDLAQKIILEIKQKNLDLKYILETHTHADFFSARRVFKLLYPTAKVGLSYLSPTKDNQLLLKNEDVIELEEIKLTIWQTPGHTNDAVCFVLDTGDQKYIFTGDTLLIGGTGRTDFQQGDSRYLFHSLQKIITLPDTTIIYPAHNYQGQTKTTLGVEKQTNSRLKLVVANKIEEFSALLNGHSPAKPDLFEESLGWNQL